MIVLALGFLALVGVSLRARFWGGAALFAVFAVVVGVRIVSGDWSAF